MIIIHSTRVHEWNHHAVSALPLNTRCMYLDNTGTVVTYGLLARLFARIHITMIKGTEKALNVLPKYNIWLPSRLFHETGIYELEILAAPRVLDAMGSSFRLFCVI